MSVAEDSRLTVSFQLHSQTELGTYIFESWIEKKNKLIFVKSQLVRSNGYIENGSD